ncbi:FixH family protein [Marinobacterium weihaiense]|uniref:FixH family protein n=1 Tax=Marinobacterium weihaiense TaxID=2851016 RepID=A0ABS6M6R6_9GAMM|nr:FixH family protein [Marinobacterium weihaiense]MBV0931973.1 FixH family protein [Marinobacterium weihaiense]
MNTHVTPPAPWFKQPWLWFILAPLIAVFIYASIFMYIAVTTSDGVVKEDYYKIARGMNIDTSRADRARELDLNADLRLDTLTGDINLRLSGVLDTFPEQLHLNIIHPTHQKYDQLLTLRSVDGKGLYAGSLEGAMSSKRYLSLSPLDESWQLRQEIVPPFNEQLRYSMIPQ